MNALENVSGWKRDVAMILGTLFGVYLLFVLIGVYLGYSANGMVNMLRRITLLIAVYAMLVLALNLHWGYTGLFNIGVAGFMAVGVYTMGLLTTSPDATVPGFGLPLWIGIPAGMIAAALVGLIVALPALRLRADYLAIVTLGFSEIVRLTFQSSYLSGVLEEYVGVATGGGSGIRLTSDPTDPIGILFYGTSGDGLTPIGIIAFHVGNSLDVQRSVIVGWAYVLALVAVVVAFYWLLVRIGNSPFGRVLKAIREDELVADSLGKDTNMFKIKVFMVGCALMGLAGILWQGSSGYTSPREFMPLVTFYVFVALMIGGSGSNTGSVLGGIVFAALLFEGPTYVPRIIERTLELVGMGLPSSPNTFYDAVVSLSPLEFLAYADANISALRFILLGVVLVLVMQNRPEGILGHRIETASSIDLSRRSAATDGGETDE